MSDSEQAFNPLFNSLQSLDERYTEQELIASGGMKRIFKVFDCASDRHVALARLHENTAKEHFDSFIREARLTAKLEHPNIMAVYDIGTLAEEPYFTMELKSGGSLDDILSKRKNGSSEFLEKYNLNRLLGIFLKVCDAVSFAHSRNVLHLDLKPANIQVGDFGEVLVCDWGLGKVLNDGDNAETDALLFNPDLLNHMTLNGRVKGTPGCMAPEQIAKDGDKSVRTDIYALGAILYSTLTDEIPFVGTTEEKLKVTLSGDLEAPSRRFPEKDIPAGLEAVALKAMSKVAEDRYESVATLRREVSQFISGYAPDAEEAGTLKQLKLFWQRNLTVCLLSTLFILVSLFGLFSFISELQKSRDLAYEQKMKAVESQQKAEKSLDLYLNEKKQLINTQRKWSHDITLYTEPLRYHFYYESPSRYVKLTIEGLTRALEIDPQNERALGLLGHQYFMTQRFNQANEIFAKSHFRQEDIYPISQKFAKLKRDDEILTVEQLTEFILDVGKEHSRRNQLSERLLAWDAHKRKKAVNYLEPVRAMLSIKNKGVRDFELDYDPVEKVLKVRGESLRRFAEENKINLGRCVLRFLHIKTLIISDSPRVDANELYGLIHLETLDVSQSKLKSAASLKDLPKLKTLIVNEGQLSKMELKVLGQYMEIIILPEE